MKFSCEARLAKPSLVLVTLKGNLDAGTAIDMEMSLAPYIKDPSVTKIVLDVPELSFVSSSGLRVIMLIIKALIPREGRLYMVGASPQIIGLIKMSGMTKWITLKDNAAQCENDV